MTMKSLLRFKSLGFNLRPSTNVFYGLREFTGFLSFLFHPFICKEQYCIGTWNVRSMNQGKLEVVKQEMARVNVEF